MVGQRLNASLTVENKFHDFFATVSKKIAATVSLCTEIEVHNTGQQSEKQKAELLFIMQYSFDIRYTKGQTTPRLNAHTYTMLTMCLRKHTKDTTPIINFF